ncbi:ABC transporter permease [Streptomyces sp. TS71-3]|uniref:ABC transporter permease n=1 Tax=Streptomyces sp. TS71-3 TaxID=2733862 RepID=UPI001B07C201|nr:ABC transporter permease [Streptomyces sp. TS71-3]GHJ41270.1 ABC transporter permease [Streptomyces sp. TS71-3]
MLRYTVTRTGLAAVQCAVVLVVVFALTSLLPGDTVDAVLGEQGTPQQAALARAGLGLDRPAAERFVHWLAALCHGDLGRSLVTGMPVTEQIAGRLAATAVLAATALALLVPLALGLGVLTGLREGSAADRGLSAAAIALHAVPEFVLGLLLTAWLSLDLGALPATAAGLMGLDVLTRPAVLILPVTVLVCRQLCDLARQVRIGIAEQRDGPVATHLRLLGVPERTILLRHLLPGTLAPAVQQFARCVDGLLGGTVVVESLFAVGGLGTGFVDAVQDRDMPAVQGYALVFAITAVVVNLCADLAVRGLTPRREGRA